MTWELLESPRIGTTSSTHYKSDSSLCELMLLPLVKHEVREISIFTSMKMSEKEVIGVALMNTPSGNELGGKMTASKNSPSAVQTKR